MKPNSETPETEFTFIIKHWYWCDACGWKKMPRVKPLPCPFCGKIPNVYPTDPSREGNAFGQVRCDYPRCAANPVVNDGALQSDERGSSAYKRLAINRWNRRQNTGDGNNDR